MYIIPPLLLIKLTLTHENIFIKITFTKKKKYNLLNHQSRFDLDKKIYFFWTGGFHRKGVIVYANDAEDFS